jgi:type IV secretion system protein VirD4
MSKKKLTKKKVAQVVAINAGITAAADFVFAFITQTAPKVLTAVKNPSTLGAATEALKNEYLLNPFNVLSQAAHSALFIKVQPLALGLFAYLTIKKLWNLRTHKLEDASDYGAHGTSRWANEDEIFDPQDITKDLKSEGTLLAALKGTPIVLKDESWRNKNVAVFGGTGAGKTASYVIPNILNTKNKSIVLTDPKGELYEKTSEIKRQQGYNVRLINFKDLEVSDRYNPFTYIKKDTDALKVAKTIVMNSIEGQKKTDFWDKAEAALLSAFILYIKHTRPIEEHHFGSVFNLATSDYKTIHELFRKLDDTHIARKAYEQAIAKLDDKVRANVFISLLITLDLWKYQDVCDFTAASDFHLQDIGQEKTIVYVILPIGEETFRPLISTFFTQLFSELYDLADRNFNKLPVPVRFILDEFNNIGKIPRFEERLSTSRSYRIEVSMIIQSIGQLRDRFGKEKADEIIDNCDTRIFLGTNAPDSMEYFSKLLGDTTKRIENESENKNDKSKSTGRSYTVIKRPLRTPDELSRLKDDEAIVFVKGKFPFNVQKAWYHSFPTFKAMMKTEVSRYDYPMVPRDEYKVFTPKGLLEEFFDTLNEKITQEATVVKKTEPQETARNTELKNEVPKNEELPIMQKEEQEEDLEFV